MAAAGVATFRLPQGFPEIKLKGFTPEVLPSQGLGQNWSWNRGLAQASRRGRHSPGSLQHLSVQQRSWVCSSGVFPLRTTVRPFTALTQPTKEPFVIMASLGFILEIFNRLLYIIEVLMELGGNQKKYHRLYQDAGFVFCILNKPLFNFLDNIFCIPL